MITSIYLGNLFGRFFCLSNFSNWVTFRPFSLDVIFFNFFFFYSDISSIFCKDFSLVVYTTSGGFSPFILTSNFSSIFYKIFNLRRVNLNVKIKLYFFDFWILFIILIPLNYKYKYGIRLNKVKSTRIENESQK